MAAHGTMDEPLRIRFSWPVHFAAYILVMDFIFYWYVFSPDAFQLAKMVQARAHYVPFDDDCFIGLIGSATMSPSCSATSTPSTTRSGILSSS
jgi:hypothetical protein